MFPSNNLKNALIESQQRVEADILQCLEQYAHSTDATLYHAMRYSVLNGGKRIRPFFIYHIGQIIGLDAKTLAPAAVAMELIHSYSLVHDDLPSMDDDSLRRGKPTCHIQFDEAIAILAGDALQAQAFEILANAQVSNDIKIKWIKTLSKAAGARGMCGGQSLDLEAEQANVTLESLELIHVLKTGALIEASITMATAAKPDIPPEHAQALVDFAKHIGLAFQVQDDILDIISTTEELGKPQGSDEALNKSTYPALLGLEGAKKKAKDLYQMSIDALNSVPYDTELLAEFASYIINRKY